MTQSNSDMKTLNIKKYSFDDDIIEACLKSRKPQIKVYCPDKTMVVMGRASKVDIELNENVCLSDGREIFRRHGGGCSVVLDKGNVIVSLALPLKGIGDNNRHFGVISQWLIENMEKTGLQGIKHDGISDLVLDNRKVAGSCIYRTKDVLYYSVSILADADTSLYSRYLKHPPREPEYRKGREHKDFVLSLGKDAGDFAGTLRDILSVEQLLERITNYR